MSETELSVICKSCGSEVSPYVTECPYCGARLRKRAPKLERHGDALEARQRRRSPGVLLRLRSLRRRRAESADGRPYATLAVLLASAALLLAQKASGEPVTALGALVAPVGGEWWRHLTAPFVYADVGYLFVVGLGLAIFAIGLERRLGSVAVGLLLVGCGALGMLAAAAVAEARGEVEVIAGGNGMALGALAAWFALRRAEARRAVAEDYDAIGVAVAAAVLLALPVLDSAADVFAGLAGAAVGGVAGLLAASALRPGDVP